MKNPIKLLHPYNRTEENRFLLSQWHNNLSVVNIPPSYDFAKESLVQNPVMKWIENYRFILLSKTIPAEMYGTSIEQVSNLMEWLKTKQCQFKFEMDGIEKGVVALDLETTGLNGSVQFYGGQVNRNEDIIGICIAFDEYTGYYIPVGNTQDDYIPNYSMEEAIEFLQEINTQKYHNVLHNAMYDLNILRNHGVCIVNMFSDTMIISKLMNNFEFFPMYVQNGLKGLSAHVLQRKMIELKEMFGEKEEIQFNRLSATTATVYGASDALNTIGLFKAFVLEDKYGRNPYKYQASNTYIVHRYIYHLISQSTCGMPIDFDHAESAVKTCIRRMILLERKWEDIVSKNSPVPLSLSSAEQTNIFVGDLLRKNFFGESDQFPSWALESFSMSVKTATIAQGKKDERVKTTYGMDDSVIQNISKKLKNMSYSDEVKQVVTDALKIVSMYRSLAHEVPMYMGLLRCAFRDDRGICIGNFSVKPEGTDTGRNASAKGTGIHRIQSFSTSKAGVVKVKITRGNGDIIGVNSQGMSATPFKQANVKKVDISKMPQALLEKIEELNRDVDIRYKDLMMSV